MIETFGGENIKYIPVDSMLKQTNYIVHEVNLIKNIFSKNNKCERCGSKIRKKEKELTIHNDFFIKYKFKFYKYCNSCGSHFFKKHGKLYFIIDEKSINLRLAKINNLLNKHYYDI